MKNPLVSVIIPTKNEEDNIKNCLESIKKQNYKNIEIIVVDNDSSDKTKEIAKRYTKKVFNKGPERSSQRNYGSSKSKGKYLLFIDADMILEKKVVEECVEKAEEDKKIGGLIIPEKSIGEGFWAKVKSFEKEFYIGDSEIEAARCYERKLFIKEGRYDENLIAAEDWDLSQRIKKKHYIVRTKSYIFHNEGEIKLLELLQKKIYYSKHIKRYFTKHKSKNLSSQQIFIFRSTFYKNPLKLMSHPILSVSMFFLLSVETICGAYGYFLNGK